MAAYSDVLCLARNEATSTILHPTYLWQVDNPIPLIDLESLRIAKTVLRLELLVKLGKIRSPLKKVDECPLQVFECLLQHLAVALCKPRPLLLPLWKQISQGNVGKPKVGIQLALFIVPLYSLVVDKTCTTAKTRKCLDIRTIWFELELKCLAKNHYTALAWQSGESQGAMRAFHPHPYGWGISARLIKAGNIIFLQLPCVNSQRICPNTQNPAHRYLPVTLSLHSRILLGEPVATMRPPLSPPPGPMSMM